MNCEECNCYKKEPKQRPICVVMGRIFDNEDLKMMQVETAPIWCPMKEIKGKKEYGK